MLPVPDPLNLSPHLKEPVKFPQYLARALVIVDDEVSIVSSMNFNQSSSADKTWEGGLVTIDGGVLNSI